MKPQRVTPERARKLVGRGGAVFGLTYVDCEGCERQRFARILKIDERAGVFYLVCEDTWLLLSTVQRIQPWHEPPAAC